MEDRLSGLYGLDFSNFNSTKRFIFSGLKIERSVFETLGGPRAVRQGLARITRNPNYAADLKATLQHYGSRERARANGGRTGGPAVNNRDPISATAFNQGN